MGNGEKMSEEVTVRANSSSHSFISSYLQEFPRVDGQWKVHRKTKRKDSRLSLSFSLFILFVSQGKDLTK